MLNNKRITITVFAVLAAAALITITVRFVIEQQSKSVQAAKPTANRQTYFKICRPKLSKDGYW